MTQLAALLLTLFVQQSYPEPWVSYDVAPDTVTVGMPFLLRVRVVAPAGSTIRFPPGPDSTSGARLLDPVSIGQAKDSAGFLVQTATYRLAAWRVDRQALSTGTVLVVAPQGQRTLSLGEPAVVVQSVLPTDTLQRIPKPAREVFRGRLPWWYPWLPLVVLTLLLASIARWWWKRRTTQVALPRPLQIADAEFARVEAMHLVEAGERARHAALMLDVLRNFLVARFPRISFSQTTAEMLAVADELTEEQRERVAALFANVDRAKFAREQLSAAAAIRIGKDAREIAGEIGDEKPPEPDDLFNEAA